MTTDPATEPPGAAAPIRAPSPAQPAPLQAAPPAQARRRWLELGAVFVLAPALLALTPRWMVTVGIVSSGVICLVVLLRDPSFDRRQLWDASQARAGLRGVALRTVVVWTGLLVLTALWQPERLFQTPRHHPGLWLMIVTLYPVLSAYSQELMFRTLFFHRYGALFRRPTSRIAASALLFGWAHVVAHNVPAIILAAIAGFLFASTYERRRSTLLVGLEHALYGDFVFTVGLGNFFYNARRLVTHLGS